MSRLSARTVVWAAGVLLAAGCGRDNPHLTGADVSGVVRHKGTPLTGGTIRLVAAGDPNKSASGPIRGDGTYEVKNAPVGEVIAVVETDSARFDTATMLAMSKAKGANVPAAPEGPPVKYMAIDRKYADPARSPLRGTVQKGTNKKDWDLE